MRNLKRVLALGMALVLTLGLMVTASAATAGTTYADDAAIGATNDEAIQVLTALGIYQGDGKNFNPADEITRQEVAALAYRITTGDVDDANIGLYKTWAKFDDVKSTDWSAGYINYVANAGILDGDGQGNFYPNAKITGYQLLKIVLCALGYGQNGEYVGADWDKRTSSKANELGLLAGVSEDLGSAISRATVAQILFNGMTKALVVDYFLGYYWPMNIYTGAAVTSYTDAIFGGSAGNADNSGNYVATLGYKQFSLTAGNTEGTTLQKLSVRADATPDTKYGEPVAKWYIDNDNVVDNEVVATAKNTIQVRFNPVATFTTAVSHKTLYAAAKLSTKDEYIDFIAVDGVDAYTEAGDNMEIKNDKDAAKNFEGLEDTGKGVVTEVFIADGNQFVVIKNTYVDTVATEYEESKQGADTALGLTGGATTDIADIEDTDDFDKAAATKADIKKDTVVIYNMYDNTVDYATIHAAPSYKVTVTNTYDKNDASEYGYLNCAASYFLAGKKYEYNALFATESELGGVILNRDEQSWGSKMEQGEKVYEATEFNKKQVVYTDDNGYVVFTENQQSAGYSNGFVVLTKAAYNNYELDNVHYVKFTGYDSTGKAVTLNGGIGTFVYPDAGVANNVANGIEDAQVDAAFAKGIYSFRYDAELGLYELTPAGEAADTAMTNEYILNGVADGLDADVLVDNTTVYVIVKYNDKGGITGYTVKTGFKTTGDLYDHDQLTAEGDPWNTALKNTDWNVTYVNTDAKMEENKELAATADLVYIEGAEAEDDNDGFAVKDEGFILLDATPEDKVTEYDLHTVVVNGKVTTMKFWPNFWVDYAEENSITDDADLEGVYYEADQLRKGYVYSLTSESVAPVALTWVADSILDAGDLANVSNDSSVETQYLTLSDKCVVYEIEDGACTAAKDITKVDTKGDETAIIAARDDYGFATVIYIVK